MNLEDLINLLEETHNRLKISIPDKIRLLYDEINIESARALLVFGQRVAGKTTLIIL